MDMFADTWAATLSLVSKAIIGFMIIAAVSLIVYVWGYLPLMLDMVGW
jgi:hypothetical protein